MINNMRFYGVANANSNLLQRIRWRRIEGEVLRVPRRVTRSDVTEQKSMSDFFHLR